MKAVDPGANALRLDPNGRGARGTKERRHDLGDDVVTGHTFTTEIDIPGGTEAWNE